VLLHIFKVTQRMASAVSESTAVKIVPDPSQGTRQSFTWQMKGSHTSGGKANRVSE